MKNIRQSIGTGRVVILGIVMAVCLASMPAPTGALDIIITFNSASSDSVSFDNATADNLTAIMNAAVSVWEDIIEDPGTLEVQYYYDNLIDNKLASHTNNATSGGKPTEATIRFDTTTSGGVDRDWWFDPTPANNSEFNVQQTLFRDLSVANQGSWFSMLTPDLFEVGFRGAAVAGGAADGHRDIYSTAIHELGHAVGLTANVSSGEYADGDYDVPAVFVWGTDTDIQGDSHLSSRVSLMCSMCGATSFRRLPTSADVLAAATGSGWSNIDLPRQDFSDAAGNKDWQTPANWIGNQIPDVSDDVYVRYGGDAELSQSVYVDNLTVAESSKVFTGSHKLDIGDKLTIGDDNGTGGSVSVLDAGGELEATTITIRQGGIISLLNGGLVDAGGVTVEDGGHIAGTGTIDASTELVNEGTITALNGSGLTLTTASAGEVWDLDGVSGNGVVNASFGDVHVTGELSDPFNGDMTIGNTLFGTEGYTVTFVDGWELNVAGDLTMHGDEADPARVAGGMFTVAGDVNVNGVGQFQSNVTFESTADVAVAAGAELELNADTTFAGGDYTGDGLIRQNSDATVSSNTTIDVATYDMDGTLDSSAMSVIAATLTINSSRIEDGVGNDYNGDLIVWSGSLVVNTDDEWRLDGNLILIEGTVSGQDLRVANGTDLLAGNFYLGPGADSAIDAGVTFQIGSSTTVSYNCGLDLNGTIVYDGGSFDGDGKLIQNGDATVSSDTTIDVATFDMDGSSGNSTTTVNAGVTLTIDSDVIEADLDNDFDGTFNIGSGATATVNTADWRLDGTLNLTNAGATPHLGGSAKMIVQGDVNVAGGMADIDAEVQFDSAADVTVAAGAELKLDGVTTFAGGDYTGDGMIRQNGAATVSSDTTIGVATFDMDGISGIATVTLDAKLTLNVDQIDMSDNRFDGTLTINNPGRLTVHTDAGSWIMDGVMNLDQNGHPNRYLVLGDDMAITGQMNVTGETAIRCTADIYGTITLGDADDFLQLGGSGNTLSGGDIVGPGTLGAVGAMTSLTGHGTISADVDFSGSGADLLADSGTLSVSGSIVDVADIGTASSSGTLTIPSVWSTSVADQLVLNGGSVTGALINNDGTTTGHGLLATAGFVNNGTLTASGGTLEINTTAAPDLDGSSPDGSGSIDAASGDVHIHNSYGFTPQFNGQLDIGSGQSFIMDHNGLFLEASGPQGRMNLHGGTYDADVLLQGGQLNVDTGTSRIVAVSSFLNGGSNLLNDDLELHKETSIAAGAVFSGTGRLIVTEGTTLTIADDAVVGVDIINYGTLIPGSSPGEVHLLGDFSQTDTGVLRMEVNGWLSGEFDRMIIDGTATLDGELEIVFGAGFTADPGALPLLEWAGYAGAFDSIVAQGSLPENWYLNWTGEGLSVTTIPEPGTLSLAALAGLLVFCRRSKRTRG